MSPSPHNPDLSKEHTPQQGKTPKFYVPETDGIVAKKQATQKPPVAPQVQTSTKKPTLADWKYDYKTGMIHTPQGNSIARSELFDAIKRKHANQLAGGRRKNQDLTTLRAAHDKEMGMFRQLVGPAKPEKVERPKRPAPGIVRPNEPATPHQGQLDQLKNWKYDTRTHNITTPTGNTIARSELFDRIKLKQRRDLEAAKKKGDVVNVQNKHKREWDLYKRLVAGG
jgi:sRNA-binding carbon storage regulator CsrA